MQSVADLWAPIPPHGLVQLQNDCLPTLIFKAISLAGKAARLFEVLGKDVDESGSTPNSESLDNGSPTTTTEFGAVAFPTELVLMRAALERFVYNLPVAYQEPLHFVQGGIPKLGLADGRGLDAGAIVLHSVIYATYQLGASVLCLPPSYSTDSWTMFPFQCATRRQTSTQAFKLARSSPLGALRSSSDGSTTSTVRTFPSLSFEDRYSDVCSHCSHPFLLSVGQLDLHLAVRRSYARPALRGIDEADLILLLPAHQAVWTLTSRTLLREITRLRKAGAGPSSTLLLPSGLGSFGR